MFEPRLRPEIADFALGQGPVNALPCEAVQCGGLPPLQEPRQNSALSNSGPMCATSGEAARQEARPPQIVQPR